MNKDNPKDDPQVLITIGPVHLRRITLWGTLCSQHGMVQDKPGHTKLDAMANANAHAQKGHIGNVAVRIAQPR